MTAASRDESRAKILSVMNAGGIGWPARLDAAIDEALLAAEARGLERAEALLARHPHLVFLRAANGFAVTVPGSEPLFYKSAETLALLLEKAADE